MSTQLDKISDLRLADVQTFLAVLRCESLTAAARALHVTPSQVSKAVARLEGQLGISLVSRSTRGITVSPAAQRLLPHFEEIVKRIGSLRAEGSTPALSLTIAAPSFLNALFLPVIVGCQPRLRVRGLELPPALVRAYAAENFFDMTMTLGRERFTDTWTAFLVGDVRKTLFATPEIARQLGPQPVSEDTLAPMTFIGPIYNHNGQFVQANEDCPLINRQIGHEVQTLATALELATRTGQLVFGPMIAARSYVERGALIEIRVRGWDVREPLYLACNSGRILAKVQRDIVAALRAELDRLNGDVSPISREVDGAS